MASPSRSRAAGGKIDIALMARGASTGFTILVLGGLLTPIASQLPHVGQYWLVGVAVIAFAIAGVRAADTRSLALQGALAALAAYYVTLPLSLFAAEVAIKQIVETTVTAAIVGALAAAATSRGGRAREIRRPSEPGGARSAGRMKESA